MPRTAGREDVGERGGRRVLAGAGLGLLERGDEGLRVQVVPRIAGSEGGGGVGGGGGVLDQPPELGLLPRVVHRRARHRDIEG